MNSSLILYYSEKCGPSTKIIKIIKNYPQINKKIKIMCIDAYYKKTNKFPNGIRGTPTIFEETSQKIKVYEGKTAIEYIKHMIASATADLAIQANKHGIPQNNQQMPPTLTNNNNNFQTNDINVNGSVIGGVNSGKTGLSTNMAFGNNNAEWVNNVKVPPIDPNAALNPSKFDGINPFRETGFTGKKTGNEDIQQKLDEMTRNSPYAPSVPQQQKPTEEVPKNNPYAAANGPAVTNNKPRDPYAAANS